MTLPIGTPAAAEAMSPFDRGPNPSPRGLLSRVFLRAQPARAKQEIINRLATASPSALSVDDIGTVLRAYGVRGSHARSVLVDVWRIAVARFLQDDKITDDEVVYLRNLRLALGLSDRELRETEQSLVHSRFRVAADGAAQDGKVTLAEQSRLDALARDLRLPDAVADDIMNSARQARFRAAFDQAVADERLSPQESAQLAAIARGLNLQIDYDTATQRMLDRYALLWRIENGDLPSVNAPINLQRGEVCHAVMSARWSETRTRTQRINYGGPVASIRICRGLRYRVGSVQVQRITREELVEIDRGTLYLTNRRLIFSGARKSTTIRLNAILSFTPYSDGVVIEKASGRPPHLELTGDVELFHATFAAALAATD